MNKPNTNPKKSQTQAKDKRATHNKDKAPRKESKALSAANRNDKGHFIKGHALNEKYLHLLTGKPKKYTPEELLNGAQQYFKHCDDNPIMETILHQKTGELKEIPRPHIYTMQGYCNFMLITVQTLYNYEHIKSNDKDTAARYLEVVTYVKQQGYEMKIAGAAAGVLNSNIIARELGLKDAQEISTTGSRRLKIEIIPASTITPPNKPQEEHTPIQIQAPQEEEEQPDKHRV